MKTEDEGSTLRIVDIARMAHVSTGTVDRVIHNRGKVSAENLQKVKAVLEMVDYRPNLMARSLASKRSYVIYAVIPSFEVGDYWADVYAGINRAIEEVGRYNVLIKIVYFDKYSELSFNRVVQDLKTRKFDAVLIATLFSDCVISFSKYLEKLSVPYVYLDSHIPDQKQLAYFGTSSLETGHVAARLLYSKVGVDKDILIGQIIHDDNSLSTQWINRELGFKNYLESVGFKGNLRYAKLRSGDESYNFKVLDDIFQSHENIVGAITFNSTCHVLGEYIKSRDRLNITLIGYDITKKNVDMLSGGVVSALIAQRPEIQGHCGIISIYEHLVLGRKVNSINYMPIDILVKENILFYNNIGL